MPIKFAADKMAFLRPTPLPPKKKKKKKGLPFPFKKSLKQLEEKSKPTPRPTSYVPYSKKAVQFAAIFILTCKERNTLLKPS